MRNMTFKVLQILSLLSVGFLIQTVQLKNSMFVDSIYMKIPYTTKFIDTYVREIFNVSSAIRCLIFCREHGTCKSVGIKTNSMACYLYEDRVYAGLSGINSSDIIYYWLQEPECPVNLGYSENTTSKICTKYNSTKVTWFEAQNQCEKEGGFLFMADKQDSRNVMSSYFNSGVLGEFTFLGATDINEEGVWDWFNGLPVDSSLTFTIWTPDGSTSGEHCITLTQYLTLGDHDCNQAFGFICQIPTSQTYFP